MSAATTGAVQLARLIDLGLRVRLLPPLRDVDLPADAEAVAYAFPQLGFSAKYRELTSARARQPTDRLFDRAFSGSSVTCTAARDGGSALLEIDVDRWSATADEADEMVVVRCEPPVLDLGCGPGRMLVALQRSGRSALGIDSSAAAVRTSTLRGGQAIRRRIEEPIPAEGRWGTALLVDGNVGIGGDVTAVLRRCRELVRPGGLVICETDPQRDRDDRDHVVLTGDGVCSLPLPWARIGASALAEIAASLGLFVCEEWSVEDRVFLALRRAA
jgi:SAM-dependent methyltransferase